VLVEKDEHASAVETVRDQAPDLKSVFVIDDGAVDQLIQAGKDVPDSELAARRATLHADSLATLIYTSGTTGRPKGCELTHANFLFEIGNGMSLLGRFLNVEGSLLLFIPLAHVLARVIHVGAVKTRTVVGHTPDVKHLVDDLGEFKPTFVLASPACSRRSSTPAKAKARATARARSSTRPPRWPSTGPAPRTRAAAGLRLKASTRLFDKLVYGKLRAALGGGASARSPAGPRSATGSATSSAASASPSTRATASPRPPPPHRSTTTTRCASAPSAGPCPGVDFRIADDGEVLIRGGIVMRGYWKNERPRREAIDSEGFFHTGDLATRQRRLPQITGRKKEILVTAAARTSPPGARGPAARHRLVSQCIVVGDQRPFIGALITLDERRCRQWLSRRASQRTRPPSRSGRTRALRRDRVGREGREQAVVPAEAIQEVQHPRTDFTEDNGMLTRRA
jgi:long-chain acyl-CoA synthetase